jgi:hypothetical protein
MKLITAMKASYLKLTRCNLQMLPEIVMCEFNCKRLYLKQKRIITGLLYIYYKSDLYDSGCSKT